MIIKRYLTKEVLSTALALTFILLLVFLSQQLVRYLNYVAVGKIPTSLLMLLVGFEVPYLLAFLLPLAFYLALMLVFGRLYADHEMAILQLYGYGTSAILRFSLLIAAVIAAFILYLMLSVNPWLSAKRQQVMASDEATVHLVETIIPGRFQVSPDGKRVMYVESLSGNRMRAQNVFLAQAKLNKNIQQNKIANQFWMIVFAKQGFQIKDQLTQEPLFVTTDGYRYEGTPGQNDFKIIEYERYAVRLPQPDAHLNHQDVEALSLSELWHDYQLPKRAAELQWRFSTALTVLILGLLAVPLSIVKPRQGRYRTLFPAILIYIIYIDLLFVAKRWVEQGMVSSMIGLWWVHGLMLVLAIIVYFWRRHSRAG